MSLPHAFVLSLQERLETLTLEDGKVQAECEEKKKHIDGIENALRHVQAWTEQSPVPPVLSKSN